MPKLPEQFLNDGPHAGEGCCTRCGRPIKEDVVWLELDRRVEEYHDFGGVPEADSQGAFAFGEDCAKALRRRARAALNKEKEKER